MLQINVYQMFVAVDVYQHCCGTLIVGDMYRWRLFAVNLLIIEKWGINLDMYLHVY